MAEVSVSIRDEAGQVKCAAAGEEQAVMVYQGEYGKGDVITFLAAEVHTFYVVRVDDTMDEAFVYFTRPEVVFAIPFDEKKVSYNPKSFIGDKHYLTIRRAKEYEVLAYRNLAKNVMDQHGDPGCYPHVHANVETRGEAVFAARNAIDGVVSNDSHGNWPYESWGINRQDDAEMVLEFGRPVEFDRIVFYTRADFPHDNWWVKATLTFSDKTSQVVEMEKSVKPHEFRIEKKGITWIRVSDLIKAEDPSPFPALTQIEVYGK